MTPPVAQSLQAVGVRSQPARRPLPFRTLAVGAAALLTVTCMMVAGLAGLGSAPFDWGSSGFSSAPGYAPSLLARREIPPAYLQLYEAAGARYELDWTILAAIGKVECDHGRDRDPSCTTNGAVNSAGAGGPMQFLASTWARYGVNAGGSGQADRWSPADAIYSAANYLRAAGAPSDYDAAIYAYNHSRSYVATVERWASLYRGAPLETGAAEGFAGRLQEETSTPVLSVAGERAQLMPTDGHVALVPADVPPAVQAMVVAGNELQDLPYGPGGHPDPRDALEEDCSSSVNYVLYRAGVRSIAAIIHENPLAQDYVDWGLPGPGRWVTIYATSAPTPHVFIVIAGLRLDTSHDGTDVGPNRNEDGPRWRIYDGVPQWAHWSVRHPPGL